MSVKAIFLDFDETVVATGRSSAIAYDTVEKLFHDHQHSGPYDHLKKEILPHARDVIQYYKKNLKLIDNEEYKTGSATEIRTQLWKESLLKVLPDSCKNNENDLVGKWAGDIYHTWNNTRIDRLGTLEKDTLSVLEDLRKKHKLVLITNGASSVQWQKIERSGMRNYFDFILVSGDEPHDKPHSSIFLKACSLCDVKPSECAMVGDTIHTDIVGANLSGLGCSIYIDVNGDFENVSQNKDASHIPSHTISSITQLRDIFSSTT